MRLLNDGYDDEQSELFSALEQATSEITNEAIKRGGSKLLGQLGVGSSAGATGAGAGAAAGTAGTTAGTTAAGTGGTVAGATAGTVGAGAGISTGWWIILIVLGILLVFLLLYATFGGVISIADSFLGGKSSGKPLDSSRVNDVDYIIECIDDGDIDLSTATTGAISEADMLSVLKIISEDERSKQASKDLTYEIQQWALLPEEVEEEDLETDEDSAEDTEEDEDSSKDSDKKKEKTEKYPLIEGYEDFENEHGTWRYIGSKKSDTITVSRASIRGFHVLDVDDSYADEYMTRWQPVLVLCMMASQTSMTDWGSSNMEEIDLNANDVADFFITEELVNRCIDVFDYDIKYFFDPIASSKDYYEYDTAGAFYNKDTRTVKSEIANVYQIPVVTPRLITGPFYKVKFDVNNDNQVIRSSVTYSEQLAAFYSNLNSVTKGGFDKDLFLYLLGQLPGTEDLVYTYTKVFNGYYEGMTNYQTIIPPIDLSEEVSSYITSDLDVGGDNGIDIVYVPTGKSVILDMDDYYINQCDYKQPRGDGHHTISDAACIDCSFTMCAEYYNRESYNIVPICSNMRYYAKSSNGYYQSFHYGNFCADYGMDCPSFYESGALSIQKMVDHLNTGNPIIIYVSNTWLSSNGDTYYSGNGHYLVICGYDDIGFYVQDPGGQRGRTNTQERVLEYASFGQSAFKGAYFITSNNKKFEPYYEVDTR